MSGHAWRRIMVPAANRPIGITTEELMLPWSRGSIYQMSEPVFAGHVPVRTEFTVLSADHPHWDRAWHCAKCGATVGAAGSMKFRDARRKAKIPPDCDLHIVNRVHDH